MRERLANRGAVDYQVTRENSFWPEHETRTHVTGALIASRSPELVIDPACGDGSIVFAAHAIKPIRMAALSDVSEPGIKILQQKLADSGSNWGAEALPIQFALRQPWSGTKGSRVVVLTEILEHLPDPDAILRLARQRGHYLIASSPEMRPDQVDDNPEHLWMFDGEGYETMLNEAGWTGVQKTHLTFRSVYNFQIWVCT